MTLLCLTFSLCCLNSALLCRADFSDLHAFEARRAFVRNIASGEAGINLADAALAIAAEDDALVSHSSVKLPVQSYAKRMQRMADDIACNKLSSMSSVGSDRDPNAVLEARAHNRSNAGPKPFSLQCISTPALRKLWQATGPSIGCKSTLLPKECTPR